MVSCDKDENNNADGQRREMTFTSSMWQAKAGLYNGLNQGFELGDSIALFSAVGTPDAFESTSEGSVQGVDGYYSKMNFVGTTNTTGNYVAVYPYSSGLSMTATAISGIVVPTEQNAAAGTYDSRANIAAAASTTTNLHFSSAVAFVRLRLTQQNDNIGQLRASGIGIAGNTTLARPSMALAKGDDFVCTLKPANATSAYFAAADYYMAIIPGTYDSIQFFLETPQGVQIDRQVYRNQNIVAGGIYTLTVNSTNSGFEGDFDSLTEQQWSTAQNILPGHFSISTNQKVRFTRGNLQYQASSGTWRFAENQYDIIGADNQNISTTYSGWIDLFAAGSGNNPTSVYADTNFYDWARYCQIETGLKTLSRDEWCYLIRGRNNCSNLYGFGAINYNSSDSVSGMFLLPDDWTLPNSCHFNARGYTSYEITEWTNMESAGAVFIPRTGLIDTSLTYRAENYNYGSGGYGQGFYWTTDWYNDCNWYFACERVTINYSSVRLQDTLLINSYTMRRVRHAVRLVKE